MATYIGYFYVNESYSQQWMTHTKETGDPIPPEVGQKALEQFDNLPPTIKPLGVYSNPLATAGLRTTLPGVWIAEADDPADLHFLNTLWAGILDFEWAPVLDIGTSAREGAAAVEQVQGRR